MSHYKFADLKFDENIAGQNNLTANAALTNKIPRNRHRFNVLAYLRVSIHEDKTGSHTFETQRQRIEERLNALYGPDNYDLEVLTDNGLSGAYGMSPTPVQRKTRKSLKEISEKLLSSKYDCFIIYNLSRFVRSPRWFHQLLEDVILPSGVDFISATQNLNFGNAEGRAMAGMFAVMDGLFRDSVVERNKDAARTRAEQGYYVGQVGYGWQWEPFSEIPLNGRRRIIPNPEQGHWVVKMKDWHLSGWGLTRIAGELNNRGVPSASGESRWMTAVIHKVLHNPVHAGLVPLGRGGKAWQQGEHARHRYYDPEVLDQIKAAVTKRKSWKTNTLKAPQHLLNGIVHCERCGKRLYVSSANTPYRSYRCENGTWQGQRTCPEVLVRADDAEQAVVRHLQQLLENPTMRELLEQETAKGTEIEDAKLMCEKQQLQDQIKSVRERFRKWADTYSRGILAEAEFLSYKNSLHEEQSQAETRLRETENALQHREQRQAGMEQVRECLLDLPTIWDNLDLDERRQILVNVLEKLTVDRVGRDAVIRIKVHLLSEQKLTVMFRSAVNMKQKPSGLQSLTPRHLAYLYHVSQGKSHREIAQTMGGGIYHGVMLLRANLQTA